jgi:hypothetical protein
MEGAVDQGLVLDDLFAYAGGMAHQNNIPTPASSSLACSRGACSNFSSAGYSVVTPFAALPMHASSFCRTTPDTEGEQFSGACHDVLPPPHRQPFLPAETFHRTASGHSGPAVLEGMGMRTASHHPGLRRASFGNDRVFGSHGHGHAPPAGSVCGGECPGSEREDLREPRNAEHPGRVRKDCPLELDIIPPSRLPPQKQGTSGASHASHLFSADVDASAAGSLRDLPAGLGHPSCAAKDEGPERFWTALSQGNWNNLLENWCQNTSGPLPAGGFAGAAGMGRRTDASAGALSDVPLAQTMAEYGLLPPLAAGHILASNDVDIQYLSGAKH